MQIKDITVGQTYAYVWSVPKGGVWEGTQGMDRVKVVGKEGGRVQVEGFTRGKSVSPRNIVCLWSDHVAANDRRKAEDDAAKQRYLDACKRVEAYNFGKKRLDHGFDGWTGNDGSWPSRGGTLRAEELADMLQAAYEAGKAGKSPR